MYGKGRFTMKKLALIFAALCLWLMPAAALAAEADAKTFAAEDSTTTAWIDAMFVKNDAAHAYDLIGESAKKNITKEQVNTLHQTIEKEMGALEGARFVSWTRFDQADQIIYLMRFKKQPIVRCELLFTKDGNLENFGLTPIEQKKDAGKTDKK